MQTFMPIANYKQTAICLDNKRLGKQRVECYQLVRAIEGKTKGWKNHPAARMWRKNIGSLIDYAIFVCEEWRERGFKDTMLQRFLEFKKSYEDNSFPEWFGDDRFHSSHRSNLLRKNSDFYKKFNWKETDDIPYYWPV